MNKLLGMMIFLAASLSFGSKPIGVCEFNGNEYACFGINAYSGYIGYCEGPELFCNIKIEDKRICFMQQDGLLYCQ